MTNKEKVEYWIDLSNSYPEYKNRIAQTMTKEVTQNILTNTKEFLQWTKQKM